MLKRFAQLIAGRPADGPPSAAVAVFGKHPGWNDHMHELGLDSAALVDVRRELYTEGVGRNVDGGAWEAMSEDERLDGFAHVFLRVRSEAVVCGRLWSSSDGRGRTRYPMVMAVQCRGTAPGEAVRRLAEPMRTGRDELRAAPDAETVRTVHAGLGPAMTRRLAAAGGGAGADSGEVERAARAALATLAARPELGPDAEGLLRVLWELERELGPLPAGEAGAPRRGVGGRGAEARGSLHRVPRGGDDPESAVARWYDLLASWGIRERGALLLASDEADWVDVLLGPPTAARLVCLRAGIGRIPLTSSVPFSLDDAWRAAMTARIATAQQD